MSAAFRIRKAIATSSSPSAGVRTLPRLPITTEEFQGHAPDTQMLYAYLKHFDGVTASHTSATSMGTDWRDNDPDREPVVEIYQGDRQNYEMPDAPRSNNEKDSIGGWKPKGFVSLALQKGYKLGFQASSDHISTHMSYCNLLVKDTSRASILDAFKKRHVYGATDDILAEVRSGKYMMGDVFSTSAPPSISVHLSGTAPFRQGCSDQRQQLCILSRSRQCRRKIHVAGQRRCFREDKLLLRARGAGRWRDRVGISDVDHLLTKMITRRSFLAGSGAALCRAHPIHGRSAIVITTPQLRLHPRR